MKYTNEGERNSIPTPSWDTMVTKIDISESGAIVVSKEETALELDGVHADRTELDGFRLANSEAKQSPSPKTARHTEERELLTLLAGKIDVSPPEKEERGGAHTKEVEALVVPYSPPFEPF